MDMTGEYRIPASRERVWAALNDPAVLRQAIPGCEAIDKSSDTEMTVKLTAKIGPVNARFAGKITLSDMDPPNGYTIFGEGTGGGFAKGGAEVTLTSDGAATILRYTAHASIGGKLARIGSRLVGGMARKMADEFFGKIAEIIAADPALVPIPEWAREEATVAAEELPALAAAPTGSDAAGRGLPPVVWIPGLVVVVGLLLWLFAV